MGKTTISWTNKTWNPVRGCRRVSPGCEHCYAEATAGRFCGPGQAYEGLATRKLRVISDDEQQVVSRWTGKVRFVAEHLGDPLKWRAPQLVFVNSMSDLFYEDLTNEQIAAVFGVMAAAPRHTFQVLTKRPQRMREWFEWAARAEVPYAGLPHHDDHVHQRSVCCRYAWMLPQSEEMLARGEVYGLHPSDEVLEHQSGPWPLPNVWLGVSVEDQERAEERVPLLLDTPAAVRFLSCEPLLGPLNLANAHLPCYGRERRVDWVIAGCESGYGMRPCYVAWLRSLRDQCAAAKVPFFLKQAVELSYLGGTIAGVDRPPEHVIACGLGSKKRGGGIIELPYLDGVRHAAFPEVHRG
jgi:protein gp37